MRVLFVNKEQTAKAVYKTKEEVNDQKQTNPLKC